MKMWKKIVLSLIVILILAAAGCAAFLNYVGSQLCATTVIDQVLSPNKTLKAVLFQIDCGATSSFNSQVVIVAGDKVVSLNGTLPESFFVADSGGNAAPAGKGGGPEVRLSWTSDTNLQIQHHELARIFKAENSSKGLAIKYATFR